MIDKTDHPPAKWKRATPIYIGGPPGIAGRVCDGRTFGGAEQEAPLPTLPFRAFPHASKNSSIGARWTVANVNDRKLHFTLNHYTVTNIIAEGHGRWHYQENIQFCRIARGSVEELIDDLNECRDENYGKQDLIAELRTDAYVLIRKINGYIAYLRKTQQSMDE